MDPKIQIEGQGAIPLSRLTAGSEARRHHLAEYWGRDDAVFCMCRGAPGIAMGVAHRTHRGNVFYLYPLRRGDNARHNRACPHYEPFKEPAPARNSDNSHAGNAERVVVSTASPGQQDFGTANLPQPDDSANESPRVDDELLGLLRRIWHAAELDRWSPAFTGKRNYGVVQRRVTECIDQLSIEDAPLAPRFLMPPPYHPNREQECDRALDGFYDSIKSGDRRTSQSGIVVGMLKDRNAEDKRGWIALSHLRPRLYAPSSLIEHMNEISGLHPRKTLVIARVDLSGSDRRAEGGNAPFLNICDIATLEVSGTKSWIPVRSDFDRSLCDRLIEERRAFDKLLSIDTQDTCELADLDLLPNYVLRDTSQPVCMELIEHMNDPAYAIRANARLVRYEQRRIWTWWWDTTRPMPQLPRHAPDLTWAG